MHESITTIFTHTHKYTYMRYTHAICHSLSIFPEAVGNCKNSRKPSQHLLCNKERHTEREREGEEERARSRDREREEETLRRRETEKKSDNKRGRGKERQAQRETWPKPSCLGRAFCMFGCILAKTRRVAPHPKAKLVLAYF